METSQLQKGFLTDNQESTTLHPHSSHPIIHHLHRKVRVLNLLTKSIDVKLAMGSTVRIVVWLPMGMHVPFVQRSLRGTVPRLDLQICHFQLLAK